MAFNQPTNKLKEGVSCPRLLAVIHHMSAERKSFDNVTFSPILNGARPLYGHVPHLNASPNPQLPQADTGLSICSAVSPSFSTFCSASALPQLQFLHAFFVAPTSQSPTTGSSGFFKSSSVNRLSSSISSSSSSISIFGRAFTGFFFSWKEEPILQDGFFALIVTDCTLSCELVAEACTSTRPPMSSWRSI